MSVENFCYEEIGYAIERLAKAKLEVSAARKHLMTLLEELCEGCDVSLSLRHEE